MRIAYLNCFAGISGDMFLAALIDAGVDPQVLHDATAALNLGASLKIEKTDRSGISATRVQVFDGTHPAEEASQSPDHVTPPKDHDHPHPHRHLNSIRKIIQAANLPAEVQQTAIHTFELLGASEAKIHNVDVEKIHFHEVGAIDAIVDITAASAGIHALRIEKWYSSPLNVGGGMVDCAHGRFPVPAPATADLLRDLPTYSAHIEKELVTPTGAALIRTLAPTFGPQPAMRIQQIGYGAGSHNPQNFPNVLRLSIGESDAPTPTTETDTVTVIETAIDDLSPQILAHVTEQALAQGALDVMCTSVQMKKGRLGTLITLLTDDAHAPALERLLLRETSTLGVRTRRDRRSCLDRTHVPVQTPYGEIRIKVGSLKGEEFNAAPEFEDCRAAAAQHNVPVKQVLQSATAAYLASKAK